MFQNTMHGILYQKKIGPTSLQLKKAKTITIANIVGILLMEKLPPFIN
jgi:hypothetical protein